MAKQTPKQEPQKARSPKPVINKSDAPTPTVDEGTTPPPKVKRYFKKTTYIKGYGIVNAGDVLTKGMAKAWAENTPVKIDAYVGKLNEALSELPKTDKEKLAEYEALNKD